MIPERRVGWLDVEEQHDDERRIKIFATSSSQEMENRTCRQHGRPRWVKRRHGTIRAGADDQEAMGATGGSTQLRLLGRGHRE